MTSWSPDLLAGQVAVITGGASGLGRATALRLADAGAAGVVIADLESAPREGGEDTVSLLSQRGVAAEFVSCDVRSAGDMSRVIAAAEDLGGVGIAVPAAGVLRMENVLDVPEDDYAQMMDVNVKGTFLTAQAAARAMVDGGRSGAIVTISSVGGVLGSASMPTYNMSKGAVRMMTYSLAASLGPLGIRVNAVHPGVIETAMTTRDTDLAGEDASALPLRRMGTPDDVADAIVYLASPLASYVTGTSLFVDGGSHSTKPGRDFG
ncbi:SDR family oxidoreductase [Aeromicrobium sp. YIM 150415]|uniref:SDR family NAD(P)-dependent oxidoreductase n=1 Tax=Aeromicrobium sp. YIM 150415 TaxID=2803912 RepID=UPI001963A682|nr:SDR family oxidoreductase [Aeromicrobium sp. YIM 150415]MBM9463459.1 SDR family oxidoreductase [Aeromicrobium sp. YIM 150415]